MSLNNITLPFSLVADLYHHALVSDTATAMPQTEPVSFLGKAGKNILILVNKTDVPYLPDNELEFLTKVLTACQLSLADVAIVNWAHASRTGMAVIDQLKAKDIILFDVSPEKLGLPSVAEFYTIQQTENKRLVTAPALCEIEKTKEAKTQLWTALKQLFGL